MAAKKKITSRATKKTSKKAAKKPAKPVAGRKKASTKATLTPEARQKLLKPRDLDLVDDILRAWAASPALRVEKLSAARLRSLAARASRAREREETLEAKQAEQLRPVSDARLIAEDAVWRAILEVKATVGFKSRHDPALAERFGFLDDAFKSGSRAPVSDEGAKAPS